MLYPKNKEKELDLQLFKNPTSEYRSAPFWAWNCDISKEIIDKEIKAMKEMGFGGFHIHPRVGLSTPYLSDEYIELVRYCANRAKEENMKLYLYDEDKWASGYAGGLNTKIIENREKKLLISYKPFNDDYITLEEDKEIAKEDKPKDKYYLLTCYDVSLDNNGCLKEYKRIDVSTKAKGKKLFAYVVYDEPSGWYNNQTYVDTLSKSAIENFVKLTHQRYKDEIGDMFGEIIPSIFTDEPQTTHKTWHILPDDEIDISLPYTTLFDDFFTKRHSYSILDKLPEVLYELPSGYSQVRYYYHDDVAELFASSYADTIGDWCKNNGLLFTGHMMMEPALWTQTVASGETMRSYRSLTIPGIDMLANHHELSTAKQCESAARQYGREGMMCELYGVTDWDYDFKGHKQQGDWLACFGVSLRVHHLFWMSMNGNSKRDYPASIGYQSPWYKEYKYIEDHFARVNTVMTRGKPIVNIGVIHPVESFWLNFGPMSQTLDERNELQRKFYEIINWLLFTNHDFDLISESLLPSLYKDNSNKKFTVGEENYDVIIVPNLLTIRSTTLNYLSTFVKNGGKVIFMGDIPTLVDALPDNKCKQLSNMCITLDWNKKDLLHNIEDSREILISQENGDYPSNLVYNYRQDGNNRNLFISHVNEPKDYDTSTLESYRVRIKGNWKIYEMNTFSGEKEAISCYYDDNFTYFNWKCYVCDSLLLTLEEGKNTDGKAFNLNINYPYEYLSDSCSYTLSEPNVMLLDIAKYSINDGEISEDDYVLNLDTKIRQDLGIYYQSLPQPWVLPRNTDMKAKVSLFFEIDSEIECDAFLGLEGIKYTDVFLNNEKACMDDLGYYIDPDSIRKIALPKIKKGKNELRIDIRFCDVTKIEAYYLLGDFGVELYGTHMKIVNKNDVMYFDDVTKQKLPFYGANITYHMSYTGEGNKALYIQRFTGSCISVDVDGKRVNGLLSFPPNTLDLGYLEKGEHTIDITLYGTRVNTLGHNHHINLRPSFTDPSYWKPTGLNYTKEYLLRQFGIFTTPIILSK